MEKNRITLGGGFLTHTVVITTFVFGGFLFPVCISDIKNVTCAVVFVCFNHFYRKSVYVSKCRTITSISC